MTTCGQIRQWMGEQPGWHFLEDILSGIDRPKDGRAARAVQEMARVGILSQVGGHGMKRYKVAREVRKWERRLAIEKSRE